jgi:uncharacterized protein (TIRG00374 family)
LDSQNCEKPVDSLNTELSSSAAPRRLFSRNTLRFVFGLVISGACILYLANSIEKDKLVDAFKMANPLLLFCSLLITVSSYLLRAYRWKFLFSEITLSFMSSYRALIIGFLMNNILPARIGEIVRAHTLGKDIGKSRTFVLATIAAERLLDGVTISLIFGFFYYVSGNKLDGAKGISYVALMFLFASLCTVLILLLRKKIFHVLERIDLRINISALSYVLVRINRFIVGLEPLFKPALLRKVTFLSLVVWTVELSTYGIITYAFNQEISLAMIALFLAAVNFSSLIPAAPGGIGVIETFASVALVKVGVQHEVALAMVVTQHAIQYIAVGIPGIYYAFLKKNKSN